MPSEAFRKPPPKTRLRIEGESSVLDGRHRLSAQSLQVLVEWRQGNLIPADEIIRLRADLAEAREALEPFAKLADAAGVQGCADDADWQIDLLGPRDGPAKGYIGDFTTADLRRARAISDRGAC